MCESLGLSELSEPLSAPGPRQCSALLSLNGQQYSNATTFRSFRPHNITAPPAAASTWAARASASPSPPQSSTRAARRSCWFGPAVTPATLLSGGEHVRCVSPSSAQAGALPYRYEEFSEFAPPQKLTLYGAASCCGEGVLKLTPTGGKGTATLPTPNLGGSALTFSFDLLLGTGSGTKGVSIMYGPMSTRAYPKPVAFGAVGPGLGRKTENEHRGGEGLEIWMRTGAVDLLQVSYNGKIVHARRMYGSLRTDAFLNATISVGADGSLVAEFGAGMTVVIVKLEEWRPRDDWVLAFGGECEEDCEAPENAQWIATSSFIATLIRTASAPLCLAIHGQRCLGATPYAYRARNRLERLACRAGLGGTRSYCSQLCWWRRGAYSCRFGSSARGGVQPPRRWASREPTGCGGAWGQR